MAVQQSRALDALRERTWELVQQHGLTGDSVEVVCARPLTPQEAIGTPERTDFPLLKGKEVMMEAKFRDSRGQAFTSMPGNFSGPVQDVFGRQLETDFDRALLLATSNALLSHLGMTQHTVHCRDEGPKKCAEQLPEYLKGRFGSPRVAFIGLQPALVSAVAERFAVRVTDLDPDNVGQLRSGVLVEGAENTADMIAWCDVVLATGSVLANNTVEGIQSSRPIIFYGVTVAGAASLLGWERYCPCAE